MSELTQFLLGGAAGTGMLGVFVVIYRLLFAREAREYARLDARIAMLEKALFDKTTDHLHCVQQVGELRGQITQITITMDAVIRRHDEYDEKLRRRIKELETKMTAGGIEVPPDKVLEEHPALVDYLGQPIIPPSEKQNDDAP